MLTKLPSESIQMPTIIKTVGGRDASFEGAFPFAAVIEISVGVPRRLGASAVVLRINRDGGADRDLPLEFANTDAVNDIYRLSLDTRELCGEDPGGLFYYEFLFLRGLDTLFTESRNNVDFVLNTHSSNRFRMLIYSENFRTPEWFRGGIMYHIFVDRFYRGDGNVEKRADAVINDDWENGIPQYSEKNGDSLSNNVFFGGNLWGVAQKLDYLSSLGVSVIYLSPIFKAYSNHKYDTGNYLEIDGMFGGSDAFENLIEKAAQKGIKVILDGVFNHTGDDSLYFDRYGKYGLAGAYSNPDSAFRNWYKFRKYPDEYESWWGIKILPKLNPECRECRDFLAGPGGVAEKYVKMGIGGWRLDVADELTDEFLDEFRTTVKSASGGEAIIIGEVWENAADKISYGHRRRYFGGAQLDSVMNYPFRNGVLAFLCNRDARMFADILTEIYSSYPKCVCDCLMNLLGTHDTERILTLLGQTEEDAVNDAGLPNDVLAHKKMPPERLAAAVKLLEMAAVLQYTVYGVPSVYYGDEAGMEGYHDPFCRRPFPWGRENTGLTEFYRRLGEIRRGHGVFRDGDFRILSVSDGFIAYERKNDCERAVIVANRSDKDVLFAPRGAWHDALSDTAYSGTAEAGHSYILFEAVKEERNRGTYKKGDIKSYKK